MATIVERNHDSSTDVATNYPTQHTDTDGAVTIEASARLNTSVYGLKMDFDAGTSTVTLIYDFANYTTDQFRYRFRVNMANVTNSNSGAQIATIDVNDDSNSPTARIEINGNSGDSGFNIKAYYRPDGKGASLTQVGSGSDAISSSGEVCLEFAKFYDSGPDTTYHYVYINGSLVQSDSIVSNDPLSEVSYIEVNFYSSNANVTGYMYFDEFIVVDSISQTNLCSASHLWLSTDGAATFSDIGDSSWGSDVVGGVVVVPGTAYQTIYAAVGTNLYKTTDGGSNWSLETAIGYEVDSIDIKKDNTTIVLANRASGGNRASEWDGSSLTHINTSKSTTGGATIIANVV